MHTSVFITRQFACVTAPGWWQATAWAPPASGGRSARQMSSRVGQRVANGQPVGGGRSRCPRAPAAGRPPAVLRVGRRDRARPAPACTGARARATSRGRAALHHRAGVQHDDVVADAPHDLEVVRDEQVAEAELACRSQQQVEDLRLHRDVERRDGLVADHQVGLGGERAGDREPLALAAGQLGRVARSAWRPRADRGEQLVARAARAARRATSVQAAAAPRRCRATVKRGSSESYGSWNTICTARRSSAQLGATRAGTTSPWKRTLARRRPLEAEDQARGGRLARAGLADQADRRAAAAARTRRRPAPAPARTRLWTSASEMTARRYAPTPRPRGSAGTSDRAARHGDRAARVERAARRHLARSSGWPAMVTNGAFGSVRRLLASRAISAACTGAAAARTPRRPAPARRSRPPYMTATSSAMLGDDAQVVRDQHDREPALGLQLAQSARISACTVTSSAVVGSSAISSSGAQRERRSRSSRAGACRPTARAGTCRATTLGALDADRGAAGRRPSLSASRADALHRGDEHLGHLPADAHHGVERRPSGPAPGSRRCGPRAARSVLAA